MSSNQSGSKPAPLLSLKNIHKQYGPKKVLNGIFLDVYPGEIVGILGPNGAGKTTLLRVMRLLVKPNRGAYVLSGFDALKHPKRAKNLLGSQLQNGGFYPKVKLKNQLKFIGSNYGLKVQPQKWLEYVDLWSYKNEYYENLSGGLKQRFAIAAALIHNPQIVTLDEPTSALDIHQRYNVWELIFRLKKEGKTILFTSHYMREASVLADRLVVLHKGVIVACDTVPNLIESIDKEGAKPAYDDRLTMEDVYRFYTK